MRIAILGAGLAGLACAHELERLGLQPEIFEQTSRVGRPFRVVETMAQFMHHDPHQDVFEYVRHDLRLPLNPQAAIRRACLHSRNGEAHLTGHLGYVTVRGPDERSLERQLLRHVKSPVSYQQAPDVYEIQHQYDWVVVATGNQHWTREFLQWEHDLTWCLRGAVVKGAFNPAELHFFFDTRYAKTGYGLLAPLDEQTATVGVGIPGATLQEAEQYWETFRTEQGHFWEQEEEQIKVPDFDCGVTHRHVLGNVMLIGNAGGFVEGLGLTGQCGAMASGVFAARQIALGDRSLDRFVRRWRTRYKHFRRIRHTINAWTDADMDRMVQAVRRGGGLLAHAPWSLVPAAGLLLDALRFPDDPSPEVGPQ